MTNKKSKKSTGSKNIKPARKTASVSASASPAKSAKEKAESISALKKKLSAKPVKNGNYAVITGASSGIGYELAKVFAKNGFDLLVAAKNPEILEASNAFRALGVEVDVCQADLATHEGVEKLYAQIALKGRHVNALCLNAGFGVGGEFAKTDLDRELEMIQLNIVSLVHLAKKVLPDMIHAGQGRILFTSSVAATMPGPYYAVYAASKAFVQSFAEALRFEVAGKGVTVTALQPGPTDTNFFARAHMIDTPAGQGKKDDPAVVAEQGYKALMANQDHVVAGSFMNSAQAVIGKIASQKIGAKLQGRSTKPNDLKNKS